MVVVVVVVGGIVSSRFETISMSVVIVMIGERAEWWNETNIGVSALRLSGTRTLRLFYFESSTRLEHSMERQGLLASRGGSLQCL